MGKKGEDGGEGDAATIRSSAASPSHGGSRGHGGGTGVTGPRRDGAWGGAHEEEGPRKLSGGEGSVFHPRNHGRRNGNRGL